MKAHRPTIMGTRHMASATQYLAAEAPRLPPVRACLVRMTGWPPTR